MIVTRSVEQAKALTRILEKEKAISVEIPSISIEPPQDWNPVDQTIGRLKEFHLAIFTSQNAVRFFFSRLNKLGVFWPQNLKVAVVGKATEDELSRLGIKVHVIPPKTGAQEELLEELKKRNLIQGKKILFPKADQVRDYLPLELEKKCKDLTLLTVYQSLPSEKGRLRLLKTMDSGKVDWITFASGSAVKAFFQLLDVEKIKEWIQRKEICIAVIGRITKEALKQFGFKPTVQPEEPCLKEMIEEMKRFELKAD